MNRMLQAVLAGAAFVFSALVPASAQSPIWVRGSGQWEVRLEYHSSDGFRCRWQTWWHDMGRPYRNLGIIVRDQGLVLYLNQALGYPRVDGLRGSTVRLVVNGFVYNVVIDYVGSTSSDTVATGWLARGRNIQPFIEDFARAHEAWVEFPNGSRWVMGLRGTMASLPWMSACIDEARARN